MERTKYSTIYLGELTQMIKDCTISSIRHAFDYQSMSNGETNALANMIAGTFDVTDRIIAALYADKDEEEEI